MAEQPPMWLRSSDAMVVRQRIESGIRERGVSSKDEVTLKLMEIHKELGWVEERLREEEERSVRRRNA